MKVNCPRCNKIYKDADKDTAIHCSCKCLFSVDDENKPVVLVYDHYDY